MITPTLIPILMAFAGGVFCGALGIIVLSWTALLAAAAFWRPLVQTSLNQGPHYRPELQ